MDKVGKFSQLIVPAKGIIFDFDGILADSEKFHFLSYREVFARHGHNINEKEYYKYWTSLGHGAEGEIKRHNLDLDPQAITAEKRPIFHRFCSDGSIKFYREARLIIEMLKKAGKKLAIASGSHRDDILAILKNEKIAKETFSAIIGKDDVEKTKPDPEAFFKVLEAMELEGSDCVVIEDAEKGMHAAKRACIPVIIAKSNETGPFAFPEADLVLSSLGEMIDLLKQSL